MAQIFLTGEDGYLGACVAEELRARGRPFQALRGRLEHIAQGSIDASVVIHAAGAVRRRGSELDHANRYGTQRLLMGLARRVPVVFVSSRSVYGRRVGTQPVTELTPTRPQDAYGLSKAQAERLVFESGLPFIILRLSTLVGGGAGQAGHSFYTQAGLDFVAGRPVTLFTPDRPHDFLFVRSAAAAVVEAALGVEPAERSVYNLAGPIGSLHALMQDLADAAQRNGLAPVLHRQAGPPPEWPLLDGLAFQARFGALRLPDDLAGSLIRTMLREPREMPESNVRC